MSTLNDGLESQPSRIDEPYPVQNGPSLLTPTLTLPEGKWKHIAFLLKAKLTSNEEVMRQLAEDKKVAEGQQSLLRQLLETTQRHSEQLREELLELRHQLQQLDAMGGSGQAFATLQEQLRAARRAQREAEANHAGLCESLEEERAAFALQKQRIERLATAIKERDKRIQELLQYEHSLFKATEQQRVLESSLEEATREKQQLLKRLEQQQVSFDDLKNQSDDLQKKLDEVDQKNDQIKIEFDQLQKNYDTLKEEFELLRKENSSLESDCTHLKAERQDIVRLKSSYESQQSNLLEEQKKIKQKLMITQNQLGEKEKALIQTYQIIEQLKEDKNRLLEEKEKHYLHTLRQREEQQKNLEERLKQQQERNEEQRRAILAIEKTAEQKEEELKVAHHHLAKKVRESARLVEEKEEFEKETDHLKKRLLDLESQLKQALEERKALTDQFNEQQTRLFEEHEKTRLDLMSYEERYLSLSKLQEEAQSRIHSLEKGLTEKESALARYQQLETLLKHLSAPHTEAESPPASFVALPSFSEETTAKNSHGNGLNSLENPELFGIDESAYRHKQHLFD